MEQPQIAHVVQQWPPRRAPFGRSQILEEDIQCEWSGWGVFDHFTWSGVTQPVWPFEVLEFGQRVSSVASAISAPSKGLPGRRELAHLDEIENPCGTMFQIVPSTSLSSATHSRLFVTLGGWDQVEPLLNFSNLSTNFDFAINPPLGGRWTSTEGEEQLQPPLQQHLLPSVSATLTAFLHGPSSDSLTGKTLFANPPRRGTPEHS